jgi:tRNA dimethylallyltransferase
MQLKAKNNRLIILIGPTGVGKTEISLKLAEIFNCEIVSADSRLFYRGMDIGTAKPTLEERKCIPHHLIDVADPDDVRSLSEFLDAAYRAIDDICQRGKLPFLVGGTGQYIFAILEGWKIPETEPDPRLRAVLEVMARNLGSETFYKRLSEIDPDAAAKIDPQNIRRMIRAFEVIFSSGRPFSEQKSKEGSPYRTLVLGVTRPRTVLYQRIDERIEAMLKAGFVEEVKGLLDRGYSPNLASFSAIGYNQIIQYIKGEITLEEAVILMKRLTRQYVRRQANWFKEDDARIHWFDAGPGMLDNLVAAIKNFLNED